MGEKGTDKIVAFAVRRMETACILVEPLYPAAAAAVVVVVREIQDLEIGSDSTDTSKYWDRYTPNIKVRPVNEH